MDVIYLLAMNTQFVVNTIIGQYNYQNFNYYLFYCNASFGKFSYIHEIEIRYVIKCIVDKDLM